MLSDSLLSVCYQKVKAQVDSVLKSSSKYVSITSDAWSNISNEPIVNYMAICGGKSLFIESVNTGEQAHNAQWIAQDISRVIESLECKVCGAITDNTATNKKAWMVLKEKFPAMFFHGCVCHGLHLLAKDIINATKVVPARGGEKQYPDDYPFEYLIEFTTACKDVIVFFHNHHVMKAKLASAQEATQVNALSAAALTRWGSWEKSFRSLRDNDAILNAVVSERDFISGTAKQKELKSRIKAIITADDFLNNLNKAILILEPIDMFLVKFQSDSVPASEVYNAFIELPGIYTHLPGLTSEEKAYLIKLIHQRFDFIYGDAHGLSYILDPRFLGDGMTRELQMTVEDCLFNFPTEDGTTMEDRKEAICTQYTEFRIAALAERSKATFRFNMLKKGSKTVLQYWECDGTSWPDLQSVALKVFAMAVSSAASERNFSTFGFIHTKLRNRLAHDKVRQLVYVKKKRSPDGRGARRC
jgi:hypothetical protein